jgi:hypothetical protein
MEISQGNCLYTYRQNDKNVIFFSFTRSENRRAKQTLSGREVVPLGRKRR